MNRSLPLPAFDRDLGLAELLSGINTEKLAAALSTLIGGACVLRAVDGAVLLGGFVETVKGRQSIRHDMEVKGWLESVCEDGPGLRAAGQVLEIIIYASARYLMASDLHLRIVQQDYDDLQAKHQALLESEARYKDLSRSLELRVAEQVKTIETTQRQLYQAEKMASVGQLAAGVAHEINNPVGFIKSNLATARSYVEDISGLKQLIQADAGADSIKSWWSSKDMDFVLDDFATLLRESLGGAERVSTIVRDLKAFSNVDKSEDGIANINEIIKGVCNVSVREITRQAELKLELSDLPDIRCMPGHLGQVFLNLLLNAGAAIRERGEIRIKTLLQGGQICVKVADNGKGIPAEIMNRIFDPFYTTNDVGQGTGLGLTVSRDIIRSHGGSIEVESEVGRGTTFTILLPVKTA